MGRQQNTIYNIPSFFEQDFIEKEVSKMVADKKTRSSEKEDEFLLQDFSRRVSAKSSALFYGNAFIVSSIPIWLYWRIHAIDPTATAIVLAIVTIVSTWLVAFAYRNTKHVLKHKVAVKREAAVTKDMNKEVSLYYCNAYQTIKPVAKG